MTEERVAEVISQACQEFNRLAWIRPEAVILSYNNASEVLHSMLYVQWLTHAPREVLKKENVAVLFSQIPNDEIIVLLRMYQNKQPHGLIFRFGEKLELLTPLKENRLPRLQLQLTAKLLKRNWLAA